MYKMCVLFVLCVCVCTCVFCTHLYICMVCVCLATYQAWGHVLLKPLAVQFEANVMHTHSTLCVQECLSRDINTGTLKPEMSSN